MVATSQPGAELTVRSQSPKQVHMALSQSHPVLVKSNILPELGCTPPHIPTGPRLAVTLGYFTVTSATQPSKLHFRTKKVSLKDHG
ncbi:hypothetical protein Y1Q_0013931 [Alligator mississippiensis]|uniref:Uncharacterized protein n=1 Tax=Alligator mississippiensis TaxID=8496 RepID=A0A151PJS7_ALLMI|nr:hypothetical protein Y1Q_0013931 [Alligator mississippiensis]